MVSTALAASTNSILTGITANGCECSEISTKVDGIFFGGDKAFGFALLAQLQQILNVSLGVGVVVTEQSLRHRLNACRTQLQKEILRPRNSAENHWAAGNIRQRNAPSHPPYQFAIQRKRFGRSAAGQYNSIGARQ